MVLNPGGHTAKVNKVVFTPDSKSLLSVSDDKTARLWDVTTGEEVHVFRLPNLGDGARGKLSALAVSPDGKRFVVGTQRKEVFVITMGSRQIERVLNEHEGSVMDLQFTPNGKFIGVATGAGRGYFYNVETGKPVGSTGGHHGVVTGLAFSPDGNNVVTVSTDKTGRLWDVSGKTKLIAELTGHTAPLTGVAWRSDGKGFVTSAGDGTLRLWTGDGKFLKSLEGVDGSGIKAVAYTPNGKSVVYTTVAANPTHSTRADAETGKTQAQCDEWEHSPGTVAVSLDGRLVASGTFAGKINVWQSQTGKVVHQFHSRGTGLWSAGWSPDGMAIAWTDKNYGDLGNGGQTRLHDYGPLERTWSLTDFQFGIPDDKFVRGAINLDGVTGERASQTKFAFKRGDETIGTVDTEPFNNQYFRSAALLPNEHVLLGLNNGAIGRIGLKQVAGEPLTSEYYDHSSSVWAVAPSPGGQYFLSVSQDQTMKIWAFKRPSAPLLSVFVAGNEWVAWTPEGYYAASPGGERLVGWQVDNSEDKLPSFHPTIQFRSSLYRPDVIKLLLKEGSVEKALAVASAALPKPKASVASVADVLPPIVLITSPDSAKFESKDATLDLKFAAKAVGKNPITGVRLLIDGRPYPGTEHAKTFDPPRTGDVRETWTVKLSPGTHTYAVVAETAASKGLSEGVEVTFGARGLLRNPEDAKRAEELQKPAMYVLAIGVSAYADEKLKLNFAAKDAEAIAKAVEAGGKAIYRKVEIKVLTDKDATRKNILQGLTWMRKQMTQNDVGVISFAGHGEKDADGTFYLLPVDVDMTDLLSSAVPGDQIKKTLAGMPGKFVVLLDACHSGGIDGEKRRAAGSLTDDLVRDLATDEYGVVVLCSSTGREFSLESAKIGHGYFTQAIIEGLNGKGPKTADGAVYLHHLDSYVTDRVKELSEGRQHPVTSKPSSVRSFPLAKP